MEGLRVEHRGAGCGVGGDPTPGVLPAEYAVCSSLLPKATIDRTGRFLIKDLPAEHIQLEAEADRHYSTGFLSLPMDAPQTLTLRRPRKIIGNIVRQHDGQPVTQFSIAIKTPSSSSGIGLQHSHDGSFVLYEQGNAQQDGPVSLVIEAPDCMSTRVDDVMFAVDAKPLTIRLPDADKLTGRITEQGTGKPLADVVVTSLNDDMAVWAFQKTLDLGVLAATARTDADGRFVILARSPELILSLVKPGYGRVLLRHCDIAQPLQTTLAKGATITGRALENDGTPMQQGAIDPV